MVFLDGERRECLVPLASLMNHCPRADAHVVRYGSVSPDSGYLEMRSQRPCAAGEQLFLCYGQLDNLKLLLFYGFLLPDASQIALDFEVRAPLARARTSSQLYPPHKSISEWQRPSLSPLVYNICAFIYLWADYFSPLQQWRRGTTPQEGSVSRCLLVAALDD